MAVALPHWPDEPVWAIKIRAAEHGEQRLYESITYKRSFDFHQGLTHAPPATPPPYGRHMAVTSGHAGVALAAIAIDDWQYPTPYAYTAITLAKSIEYQIPIVFFFWLKVLFHFSRSTQ
jgi:hypothetical protein